MNTKLWDLIMLSAAVVSVIITGILIFRTPEQKFSSLGATQSKNGKVVYVYTDNRGSYCEREYKK